MSTPITSDVSYVLPTGSGAALIDAREKAFWTAKANNADDIIDMVVPRGSIPEYLGAVQAIGQDTGSLVVGCGHAGDGNVHLSVFQPDVETRKAVVGRILRAGADLGGGAPGLQRPLDGHGLLAAPPGARPRAKPLGEGPVVVVAPDFVQVDVEPTIAWDDVPTT